MISPSSSPAPPLTSPLPKPKAKRTRIARACDRCRIKKAKCNGSTPCKRCIEEDAICVFSERQYSQNRVVPKGYIELLEDQQAQLILGLRELYRRAPAENAAESMTDHGVSGPLPVHDILESLGLVSRTKRNFSKGFQEDLQAAQRQLFAAQETISHEPDVLSHGRSSDDSPENSNSGPDNVFSTDPGISPTSLESTTPVENNRASPGPNQCSSNQNRGRDPDEPSDIPVFNYLYHDMNFQIFPAMGTETFDRYLPPEDARATTTDFYLDDPITEFSRQVYCDPTLTMLDPCTDIMDMSFPISSDPIMKPQDLKKPSKGFEITYESFWGIAT